MARKSTKKEDILDNKADEVIVEEADSKKNNEEAVDATVAESSEESKEELISDAASKVDTDEAVDAKENDNVKREAPTHYTSKTFGYSWNGVEMDF